MSESMTWACDYAEVEAMCALGMLIAQGSGVHVERCRLDDGILVVSVPVPKRGFSDTETCVIVANFVETAVGPVAFRVKCDGWVHCRGGMRATLKELSDIVSLRLKKPDTEAPVQPPTEGERLAAFFARSEHEGQPSVRAETPEFDPAGRYDQWWRDVGRDDSPAAREAADRCYDDNRASLLENFRQHWNKKTDESMLDFFDLLEDT